MPEILDIERGPNPEEVLKKDLRKGLDESLQGGSLLESMRVKIEKLHENQSEMKKEKFTIFRVPERIKENKKHLFEPSVISVGPYHHGRPHLRAMQEMKWRFLRDSLSRRGRYGVKLHDCIEAVKELEMKARGCYVESNDMCSDSFVEMMVLDGCFIIEYFYKIRKDRECEFIEDAGWSSSMILNDLILMENQVPFFILQGLYKCLHGKPLGTKIINSMAVFLICGLESADVRPFPTEIYHLLHLCHFYIVTEKSNLQKTKTRKYGSRLKMMLGLPTSSSSVLDSLPSATQLRDAGVKFRKKSEPSDFLDITFESGVLEIPLLRIDDNLSIRLMNFIALEQCASLNVPPWISTYTMFMDEIVNTANDVTILQRKGIIDNTVSSEEEVALLFNQTGQGVPRDDDHYLAKLFQDVNKFCQLKKHKYMAKLKHGYFNSPWAIISVGAGVILLLLTFTQTFYSVFSYYLPRH